MFDHRILDSPAWIDLGGTAAKLLLYLARLHNGTNNGDLFLAERAAADAIGVRRGAAAAAFDELEAHGFIAATQRGAFTVKVKLATSWRLTFHPTERAPATHDYRDWRPA
jgi:DNA-binding transcriptional MocR family regulator